MQKIAKSKSRADLLLCATFSSADLFTCDLLDLRLFLNYFFRIDLFYRSFSCRFFNLLFSVDDLFPPMFLIQKVGRFFLFCIHHDRCSTGYGVNTIGCSSPIFMRRSFTTCLRCRQEPHFRQEEAGSVLLPNCSSDAAPLQAKSAPGTFLPP